MKKVVFKTTAEKARGLIGMTPIPKNTLFIFQDLQPGSYFHSRGVLHPFEIAFVNKDGTKTEVHRMVPPDDEVNTPEWATVAVEAAEGTFPCLKSADGFRGLGQLPTTKSYAPAIALLIGGIAVAAVGVRFYKKLEWDGPALVLGGASMAIYGLVHGIREYSK